MFTSLCLNMFANMLTNLGPMAPPLEALDAERVCANLFTNMCASIFANTCVNMFAKVFTNVLRTLSYINDILVILINQRIKFAGPSAQRRVGISCGWCNGQRVLLSIDPGVPCRPETWRCRISGGTCSTLWRSTA